MTRKPPILATALMLLGVAVLCALGTWQVQRLEWKTQLLEDLNRETITVTAKDIRETDLHFQRVTLNARPIKGKTVTFTPRTHEGDVGVHILSAYKLSGETLIVNHGWAPNDWDASTLPKTKQTLTGILRRPPEPNAFTPANTPEKNQWHHVRLDELTEHWSLKEPLPLILYLSENPTGAKLPIPAPPNLPNNHKQYAFFWFAMAGILLVIYGLRFFGDAKKS